MQIFLSYNWKQSNIADEICSYFKTLESSGVEIVRDKDRLTYMQDIKAFMKNIKKSDFAVLIISDEYLESENCMYEISELMHLEDYKDRILVLLSKNTQIFNYADRLKHIKFWNDKYSNLNEIVNEAGLEAFNRVEADENLRKYNNIRNNISPFLEMVSNLNLIRFEHSFEYYMFLDMLKYLGIDSPYDESSYYVLAITKSIAWGRNECIWWSKDDSYTGKLSNAKVFCKEEIDKLFSGLPVAQEHKKKKYVAIPKILIDANGTELLPFSDYYLDSLRRKKNMLIGNVHIYLSEDELKIYR